jgi:hypothetical protein
MSIFCYKGFVATDFFCGPQWHSTCGRSCITESSARSPIGYGYRVNCPRFVRVAVELPGLVPNSDRRLILLIRHAQVFMKQFPVGYSE